MHTAWRTLFPINVTKQNCALEGVLARKEFQAGGQKLSALERFNQLLSEIDVEITTVDLETSGASPTDLQACEPLAVANGRTVTLRGAKGQVRWLFTESGLTLEGTRFLSMKEDMLKNADSEFIADWKLLTKDICIFRRRRGRESSTQRWDGQHGAIDSNYPGSRH